MIQTGTKAELQVSVEKERTNVESYENYEIMIKRALETYVNKLNDVSFENDAMKTMILNNFENSVTQVEGILQDIQALSNVLDILESQKTISDSDIETFNKLELKVKSNMETIQGFLVKILSLLENVEISGEKKVLSEIKKVKAELLQDLPYTPSNESVEVVGKHSKKSETKASNKSLVKSIKKNFDYTSSDLLCFFPKKESDSLVLSTIQKNYKISFSDNTASISIEDDNFNMTLNTCGVQITNSETNNVIFVSHCDSEYTILTNNQIEIQPFIQVSKISKDHDFINVEITSDTLNLVITDNVINFEESSNVTFVPKAVKSKHSETSIKETSDTALKGSSQSKDDNSVAQDAEITDNDTLVISDSNKNVILPYKVADLEAKLAKNKHYSTLQDVIKNEYTIPIETFKNPAKSRFREAFQLIKKKEHGSLKEAIELGFELMFQSNLNPAIIAACKDLDELDIYLDCLDDKELEKFSCFKIQYDVPPAKKSKK